MGAEATSLTCRTHPRFIEEYGPFREVSLCASCPAACDLLLGSTAPLSFLERETAEPEEPGDPWLCGLLPLRERMLRELADRPRPLQERLEAFLLLAAERKSCWRRTGQRTLRLWQRTGRSRRRRYRRAWPVSTRPAGAVQAGGPGRGLAGAPAQGGGGAAAAVPETLLERLGTYFAFRYLLKAVNDGDLLGQAQFCVLMVLTGTAPDGSMWLLGGCPPPLL